MTTLEKEMRDLARDLMRTPTEKVEKGRIIEALLKWADSISEPIDKLGDLLNALKAIEVSLNGAKCGRGIIDCPVCKSGKLRYSKAAYNDYNGHIHAACTTKNCVRWME